MRRIVAVSGLLLALVLPLCPAAADVVPIAVAGVSQNILSEAPSGPPVAAVMMFPGGDGVIGIAPDGHIATPGNFLTRTRADWLAQGFLYVAVDAPPSRAHLPHDRVGYANMQAIAAIVRAVHARTTAPIWLVGTSAGAPAALAGAASLPAGSIAGVVVSSPVSMSGPRDSVFDASLPTVRVPVLIQVDRDDACRLSPPGNAAAIKASLRAARAVDVQVFPGGTAPRSGPCGPRSPHGFFGIEDRVVAAAAAWIKAH